MELRYVGPSGAVQRNAGSLGVASRVAPLVSQRAMLAQVRQGAVPEPQWRDALRAICEDAHHDGVPAEQLLVELKRAIGILCDAFAVPRGPARWEFTSRVVTLCIEEFYASAGEARRAARPGKG